MTEPESGFGEPLYPHRKNGRPLRASEKVAGIVAGLKAKGRLGGPDKTQQQDKEQQQ